MMERLRKLRHVLEEAVLKADGYLRKSFLSALEGEMEKAKEQLTLATTWRDLADVIVDDMETIIATELPPPPAHPLIIP